LTFTITALVEEGKVQDIKWGDSAIVETAGKRVKDEAEKAAKAKAEKEKAEEEAAAVK
jgi:hypothetical protein